MSGERQRRIGGTDISKLCGLSSYGDEVDVYERIVEGKTTPVNPRMLRGQAVEPIIRDLYLRRTQAVLVEPHPGIVIHPQHDFATASLDDLARRDGVDVVTEYKSCNVWAARKWGQDGTDEIPDHYLLQCHWYMAITGRAAADVPTAFGVDDAKGGFDIRAMHIYRISKDPELEAHLLEVAGRFWREHVLTKSKPIRKKKSKEAA